MSYAVNVKKENPLIDINEKNRFYFVHSYYVKCNEEQSISTTQYGFDFTCMVKKENIFGAQFHPEKSLRFGMKFLENFVKL
jgi:glutamine amidotransferase